MKELLYRPSWQLLRVSWLQQNRNDGGWTTAEGTRSNLRDVLNYVEFEDHDKRKLAWRSMVEEAERMGWDMDVERDVRLYRTINCLNAVRMGNSGQGQRGSQHDLLVLDIRNYLQSLQTVMYHQRLSKACERWDWRVVAGELNEMYQNEDLYPLLDSVYENLCGRMRKSDSALAHSTKRRGGWTNRRELATFIHLMETAQDAEA